MEVYDDVEAELDRLDLILGRLTDPQWKSASAAPGWSIADVVLHLAQTEEFVLASVGGGERSQRIDLVGGTVDEVMGNLVAAERATPPDAILDRWRAARTASLAALRRADPTEPLQWVAAPLKPASLATTRLAEHWAHALDITGPLGIAYDDTDRLRHVAWLAHRTLPYAFSVAFPGTPAPSVYAELTAPSGATWRLGVPGADLVVTGPGGEWCRLGAKRLTPEQATLTWIGDLGPEVLRALRNYAA
ncbi:MAG TPA: maleylpyruvate isomerase family mycothiol-dependent enzyme [Mycobacteriales bacterium]|nr:maleylpyruvate isomerase family mycothiol-dependent enzyme [Mycobacteriales bacterium]